MDEIVVTETDIAFVDARRLRRKMEPRVALTFKVSRRVVRALAFLADRNEATVVATVTRLAAAARARGGLGTGH